MSLRGWVACFLFGAQCFAMAGEPGVVASRAGPNPLINSSEWAATSLEVPGVPSIYFIVVTRIDKAGQIISTTRGVGFSYERDGTACVLLTAAHVVKDTGEINAYLWTSELNAGIGYEVSVRWVDEERDLAALVIKGTDACKPVRHNDDKVPIGRRVYAYHHAPSLRGMVTSGMVGGVWQTEKGPMIVCDMVVYPGQSGSPVLDAQGLLIGMVVRRIRSEEVQGAFALPAKAIDEEFYSRKRASMDAEALGVFDF